MSFLARISIKRIEGKLLLAFSCMGLLIALQGALGIYGINALTALYRSRSVELNELLDLKEKVGVLRLNMFEMLGTSSPEKMDAAKDRIITTMDRINAGTKNLAELGEARKILSKTMEDYRQVMQLHYEFNTKKAYTLINGDSQKDFESLDGLLSKHLTDMQSDIARNMAKTDEKLRLITVCAFAGGLLIALIWGIAIIRSIAGPLNHVISALTAAAANLLSCSRRILSTSQQLAEGTSKQAAAIDETSASIEEMSSMTRQNADNSNQANLCMMETSKVVEEAKASMSELTTSMDEISKASEATQKIIKTIDEIAFQTNLLALNAAVEAARAGEAGAGFAVVADEVRNLAMRAAEAARNTADLIEGTVKRVKAGTGIVLKTSGAFEKVASGAKKVGDLVGEITAASNEQAQGISQLNQAVAEVDKVTQQNAANAGDCAATAEEMSTQAESMKTSTAELAALIGSRKDKSGAFERGEKPVDDDF